MRKSIPFMKKPLNTEEIIKDAETLLIALEGDGYVR